MKEVKDPLVWIDLEMTGLDLEKDRIIEIACIVTDGQLNAVEDGPGMTPLRTLLLTEDALLDGMDEWCTEHHGALLVGVLAGNSVHVDKEFLRKGMPRLLAHLHYRIVDVSTLKELAWRWDPSIVHKAPQKVGNHRALEDIRESIKELQYYRNTMLKI
ncbi:ribonuclease H-like domain-containing protein [Chytridium lagenaria]|nr:ribonuclease H-like domain-containing protein [Chytridium lagenaria]